MVPQTAVEMMIMGEGVVRFVEYDPEDGRTYLHYFTRKEVWDFIEVNFLTTGMEEMREKYLGKYRRDFLADYYLYTKYGVDPGEAGEGDFIVRCLRTFGVEDIAVMDVTIPVFPTYVLSEDATWIVA